MISAALTLAGCQAPQTDSGQSDPGTEGNGTVPQPAPYSMPEEARQLDGAPEGVVGPAAFYESSAYPGLNFQYRVYVPAQYADNRPSALVVFQDGGSIYLDFFKAPTVLANLIHAGDIPVAIALFINPGTPSGEFRWEEDDSLRSQQYDAVDDRYARFLLDEIIPDVILNKYNVVDDPNGWAVIGFSSGGIASFTAGWHRPDRFRKILTQNGSFVDIRGGGAYPDSIRQGEPRPLRIYQLSGTNDLELPVGNWFDANNAVAAALGEMGYAYRYRTGSGQHYPPEQALDDFPAALRWLWRGYDLPR